jgi:FkbM family methyltransferase
MFRSLAHAAGSALPRSAKDRLVARYLEVSRNRHKRTSYSQCGEDIIVAHALDAMAITKPVYLDIGAHHARWLSNTRFFYERGASGILVEPDPILYERLRRARPRDVCINAGVAGRAGIAPYFVMSAKVLNTFSREDALQYEREGHRIEQTLELPLVTPKDVLAKHPTLRPNFVSIDVEGLDLEILKAFDFDVCKPEVFCVETISYAKDRAGRKNEEIGEWMETRGYFSYADTYINTIFVNRGAWERGLAGLRR